MGKPVAGYTVRLDTSDFDAVAKRFDEDWAKVKAVINNREEILMHKRVSVDLNGVLDMYEGWKGKDHWHPPRPGVLEFLEALNERGYEVFILTARPNVQGIWDWLRKHKIAHCVDNVSDQKYPSFAYIDDRAICFRGDFNETLQALDEFHTHWEDPQDPEWPDCGLGGCPLGEASRRE